jgi:hypothetical protein
MPRTIAIAFLVLHGLVHLLYLGQATRLFELQPGLTWPSGSWLLSKALGDNATRALASALCVAAALAFVIGAAGLVLNHTWWRPVIVGAATISTVLYLALWNGKIQRLDQQGAVGIVLNAAILAAVLLFRWPR